MKPLHDIVLVRAEKENLSKTIIATKDTYSRGEVVATGPGAIDSHGNRVDMPVSEGDKVFFTTNIIREDKDGDDVLIWMRVENIIGKQS